MTMKSDTIHVFDQNKELRKIFPCFDCWRGASMPCCVWLCTVSRSLGTLVGGNHQRAHAETWGLCGPAVAQLNPDPWSYAIRLCWIFSAMADGNHVFKKPIENHEQPSLMVRITFA